MSPGQHVAIESIVDAHGDGVGTAPAEQRSDLKHELRVTFARMLSGEFPIYPDCGCVEYGLKFDPYRGVLPFTRSVEGSPIPGDTAIVSKSGVNLPGVRHAHFTPVSAGVIGAIPALLRANSFRISPKPPFAAQAHRLRSG
jgi:hypothetical protein